jgi:hypothetical protein
MKTLELTEDQLDFIIDGLYYLLAHNDDQEAKEEIRILKRNIVAQINNQYCAE